MLPNVEKNENEELPVPMIWRQTIYKIVDELKKGNFQIQGIKNVDPLDVSNAETIRKSIDYYDDKILPLPEETWSTSTYRWVLDHWEIIIDLFTEREGLSDLSLFINVSENSSDYTFQVESIHVP